MSCCMSLKRTLKTLHNDTCPTSLTQLGQFLEQFQNCLLVVFLRFCENFIWPYTKKYSR
ncbi:hypothetical protein C0J52_22778 [Blattella germanica]|nr:hypothetical protein C0J52_22778 [Blattella germanica]